ncbi:MAG: hypothetical protein ABI726_00685 [bacterium]
MAVVAVAAAVALFIVLSADDEESTTSTTAVSTTETTTQASDDGQGGSDKSEGPSRPEVATIEVKNGQPVGGVQELTFTAGDEIRFDVKSDTASEVHFHGYDVIKDVEAGGEASFDLPAEIEGVFEVELEETATQIAEITVEP